MPVRARETGLWEWLRGAERQIRDRADLRWGRVENSVEVGWPDVIGCYREAFTIELKSVPRPASGIIDCEVKPSQALFAKAWCRAGGNAWVLVQVGTSRTLKRYLVHGRFADSLVRPIPETLLAGIAEHADWTEKPFRVLQRVSTHLEDY